MMGNKKITPYVSLLPRYVNGFDFGSFGGGAMTTKAAADADGGDGTCQPVGRPSSQTAWLLELKVRCTAPHRRRRRRTTV